MHKRGDVSLVLPSVRIDVRGGTPAITHTIGISDKDMKRLEPLLFLETCLTTLGHGSRCIPLGRSEWAIGRTFGNYCIWRLVPRKALSLLIHPAWLWIVDRWFDAPNAGRGPVPKVASLAHQLRQALPLEQYKDQNHHSLAAAIEFLRNGGRPLAIIVDPTRTNISGQPLRWFALALLTSLPPHMRSHLRISTGEKSPSPEHWDVVFTADRPKGFHHLDFHSTRFRSNEPVSRLIFDNLQGGNPERIEAISYLRHGTEQDSWGAGVARFQKDKVLSSRQITPDMVRDDPSLALEHILRLLAAGKTIHTPFARRLSAYTLRTGDPTPWHTITSRTPIERTLAVRHYLEHPKRPPIMEPLLYALGMARPNGKLVGLWCKTLLDWSEQGPTTASAEALLLDALTRDPMPQEPATRGSLWSMTLHQRLRQCRFEDARRLFRHPATYRLIREDAGRVVLMGWLALPHSHRNAKDCARLCEQVTAARDADRALLLLAKGLSHKKQDQMTAMVVAQWARFRSRQNPRRKDALMAWVKGTPYARSWAASVAHFAREERFEDLLQPLTDGPLDSLWSFAEASRARSLDLKPRERFLESKRFLPSAGQAIERGLRRIINDMISVELPDHEVSQQAQRLCAVPGASSVWAFFSSASAPLEEVNHRLREALQTLMNQPPRTHSEQLAIRTLATGLGNRTDAGPEELASWLVVLLERFDNDSTDLRLETTHAFARGMNQRDATGTFFAQVTSHIAANSTPPQIFERFVSKVIPAVWSAGAPSSYIDAVDTDLMHPDRAAMWRSTVFSSSRPAPKRKKTRANR